MSSKFLLFDSRCGKYVRVSADKGGEVAEPDLAVSYDGLSIPQNLIDYPWALPVEKSAAYILRQVNLTSPGMIYPKVEVEIWNGYAICFRLGKFYPGVIQFGQFYGFDAGKTPNKKESAWLSCSTERSALGALYDIRRLDLKAKDKEAQFEAVHKALGELVPLLDPNIAPNEIEAIRQKLRFLERSQVAWARAHHPKG